MGASRTVPVWRPWKRHAKPWIKTPESKAAGHWRSSSGRSRPQPRRNQMSRACPRSSTICASISNAATCRNKKRAEGGDHGNVPGGGGRDIRNGRGCHACGSKDHFVKDCPLVVKARALQASTTENATTASALMTTALLASTATPCTGKPMMAHFDSAATAHMGPDVSFLRNAKPSNVGIEVYNNEVVTNNMEGVFVSHSIEGNLPDGRGYTNPSLPTTLISGPQVVFEHPKQDVVLSEQHGSFMQPTSKECPICNKHEQRINFDGGPAGFTLEIFPGRKDASERALWNAPADVEQSHIERQALAGEPVANAEQVKKHGD